ncbi:hypothetical protein ENBRE01_1498, partial [Enteropsectra breve]
MTRDRLNNDERRLIIDAYIAGHSVREIAIMFQLKRPAIYAVIKKYQRGEQIERRPHGGNHTKKLNETSKLLIRSWIDEDCGITLKNLQRKVLS